MSKRVVQWVNTHYDLDIAIVRGKTDEVPIQLVEGDPIQANIKSVLERKKPHISLT